MVSTDLLDARRAVEATGLAIPTDFDSPLQGVRLLAELLKMLTCFPECDKIMREQISLLYPQNWPSEDN